MLAVAICIVISCIYSEFIAFKEGKTNLEYKLWDIKTCTTADYAVRLNLTEKWFEEYKKRAANKK
jgi:hypothetical protein